MHLNIRIGAHPSERLDLKADLFAFFRGPYGLILLVVCTCFYGSLGSVHAAPSVSSLFASGMVLQRGQPVPIWGWADAGERIQVHFAGQHHTTQTDPQGRWRVTLRPLQQAVRQTLRIRGKKEIRIHNVFVGEVWLCSGQSNMAWPLVRTHHGPSTLKKRTIKDASLRLFQVPHKTLRAPLKKLQGGRWSESSVQTARHFSAICFYFGQMLRKKLQVPVGLIQSTWGGTKIEAWMSDASLRSTPYYKHIQKQQWYWEKVQRVRMLRNVRWYSRRRYIRPAWHGNSPSGLYNGMIAPLLPFRWRGVLWYQGESNIHAPHAYAVLFPMMIERWRWRAGHSFPFLFAQIAPFRYRSRRPDMYNLLCEAQTQTVRNTHKTAMVVLNDVTQLNDIHPRAKHVVARRMMQQALQIAYARPQSQPTMGPIYRTMQRVGNKLIVLFDHVGRGLQAKGTLKHFQIAGKNKRFVSAQARIRGKHVIVWSPHIRRPVAVRFAWREDAIHSLFNKAGLPASTFRTDRWKK